MQSNTRSRLAILATPLLALAAPTGAQDSPDKAGPWFEEVAAASGIDWAHVSGASDDHWFPEIMGGGCALFDADGDGDLDLYLIQSGSLRDGDGEGPTNRLYRNDGNWTFVDATEASGLGDAGYGMGAACGDYDRDGDIDLYVTNVGSNVTFRSNGDGTFKRQTGKQEAAEARWSTSAGFFDADGNGRLDLFVVQNLNWSSSIETPCVNYYKEPDYCSPNNYNAASSDSFFTYGRLGFTDSTLRANVVNARGNGLGLCIGDHDLDGDLDVYVANDATANCLWTNDGKGVFEDTALQGGCAVNGNGTPEAGMGVQFVDLDEDGDLDLFMTHLRREKNTFYRNRNGRFSDASNLVGTSKVSQAFTGFGMGFQDFDLDGVLDLYVANGAVQEWKHDERFDTGDPYAEPNHLFKGTRKGKRVVFDLVQDEGATAAPIYGTSRGAAFGDLDNDGDTDIVVVDRDAKVKVLRNVAPRAGRWVGFSLLDAKGKPVQCATVMVNAADGRRLHRQADPAYSYLCSNDPRAHFGLGALEGDTVGGVRVRWPGGKVEAFPDVAADAYHVLKQGSGSPVSGE